MSFVINGVSMLLAIAGMILSAWCIHRQRTMHQFMVGGIVEFGLLIAMFMFLMGLGGASYLPFLLLILFSVPLALQLWWTTDE